MISLTPVGPGLPPNVAAVLKSHEAALRELSTPTQPVQLAHRALKADLPPAGDWKGGVIICDEINAIVQSTLVASVWTWLRADGSAL